jgi:ketosteroid isomerase-like protein
LVKLCHWIHYRCTCNLPRNEEATSGFAVTEIGIGADYMSTSRRSILAAAGAGFASLASAGTICGPALAAGSLTGNEVAELVRRSAESNAALMRGDVNQYRALIALTGDFTLMSPFGGAPTHGLELTPEKWEAMGRFFRNGTFDQELIQSYAVADMVVLAVIERARVEVGGLPAQEWPLRVTLVYRRDGSQWRLAHRHADPLVKGISLEHAAALARGEAP